MDWENDKVQFARVVAGLGSLKLTAEAITGLCGTVGMTLAELNEIIARAQVAWEDMQRRS